MGMLDGFLGQLTEHVDVANLAQKLGLKPEQVEQAIAALTQAHGAPSDTVTTAAQSTGLSPDILQQIVAQIGGEGALGRFAEMLGGNQAGGGIGGMLGGMLGGKS